MKIDTIRVKNFRCYTDKDESWGLVFRPNLDLNLIIGPNGAGKTALLDAIDLVMNVEGRTNQSLISEYDFPLCDISKQMCVEIVLTEIGQAVAEFESDIQWIDTEDGEPIENKGIEICETGHTKAVIIRFEASLDTNDGEIKWSWILPKFPETGFEKPKELTRNQHSALGYFRIRPAVTAGAFTLGQYSVLGRHLRKLHYRLGILPVGLRGESKLPDCTFDIPKCEECQFKKDCCPDPEHAELGEKGTIPIGMALCKIVGDAKNMLGVNRWGNRMGTSLGPRYGGLRSSLAALTIGLRAGDINSVSFIPFERLSAGEKYTLSFSLAKAQVPGDTPPVIIMEEPETALYQTALAKLMSDLQATPTGATPQVIVSSHSESVLRSFSPQDVYILGRDRVPRRVEDIVNRREYPKRVMARLETLIMPGGSSALFAEKILLVEGAQDTLVSGQLDRLAAKTAAMNQEKDCRSFASLGWCVFESAPASNTASYVRLFKSFGKEVAALFDGDGPGKKYAVETKDLCATFIYKSMGGGNPEIEDALLKGLPEAEKEKVIEEFFGDEACDDCDKKIERKCWKQGGNDCYLGDKTARKKQIQSLCINKYFELKQFPQAFRSLLEKIESSAPGKIHDLIIDTSA